MEHPDITEILRNGYPAGYEEPDVYYCPVCGKIVEELIYKDKWGEIVGCDRCIRTQEYWEIEK